MTDQAPGPTLHKDYNIIIDEGQNLEEPICEEKTKTILGKVVAGELPEEILKTVHLPKLPKAEISL